MNVSIYRENKIRIILNFFLLAGLLFANKLLAAENMTDQKIVAYVEKRSETYEIINLNRIDTGLSYSDGYLIYKEKGSYNGSVLSFNEKVIGYFGIDQMVPILCTDSIGANGEFVGQCKEVEDAPIHIEIPFFPNGKKAEIYKPDGQLLFEIDLTSIASCNENMSCEGGEDNVNCPSDCEKQVKENGIKEEVINNTEGESSQKGKFYLMLAFAVVDLAAIFLIALYYFWWRRRKQSGMPNAAKTDQKDNQAGKNSQDFNNN